MIAIVSVEITAANPSMPLFPWRAYLNSPSSLRIRNVPRRVGNWNIDKVYVTAAYPDNSIKSANCVLVGGIWVCTIEGSTVSGFSQNGYTVFADGKDENGNDVVGYCLGKGDITILEADGQITPGETAYYVHMLSSEPSNPKEGDLYQISGSWYIYQDSQAWPIGDDSGIISELSAELSTYEPISSLYNDVSSIVLSSTEGEWTITNQTDWSFDTQPHYVGNNQWEANFQRGGDFAVCYADGDENATSLHFDDEIEIDVYAEKSDSRNTLGIVTYDYLSTELSTKQDKLTDPQLSAIDSVVNERATTIAFTDGTISSFNWQGEINYQTVADEGLFDTSILVFSWTKKPTSARIGTMVSSIGDYLFSGCTTLTSVSIPDSVVDIKTGSFVGCSHLSNFALPNSLTSIGQAAFQSFATAYSNAAIDIPDSVKVIGNRAFIESGLTKITIGRGINSIGSDAFLLNDSLTNVTFIDRLLPMIQSSANYPWGITNTSIIKTWHDASQEWVEAKGYAQNYQFRNASITPLGGRKMTLTSYYVNAFTVNSEVASFKVVPGGTAGTTMRDMYLALTLGANVTQPMTWDATVDIFDGGSAEAIAPKAGTTNVYHLTEYASGHFKVILADNTYSKSYIDTQLGDIETILNNL